MERGGGRCTGRGLEGGGGRISKEGNSVTGIREDKGRFGERKGKGEMMKIGTGEGEGD